MTNHNKRDGECEACSNVGNLTVHYGNMWLCDSCWEKEQKAQAENMKPEKQQERVDNINKLIQQSKQIDSNVQMRADLHNAATIAAVELKALVQHDESIAPDQKDYAYTKLCAERYQQFKKVVFDQREELLKNENIMRMWQIQTQTSAATLRTELREQFKQFDVTYQPTPVKSIKPAAPKTGKNKFQKEEVFKYAGQFGVPADAVQMLIVAKKMTPEQAAKYLAVKMGLVKE